MNASPTCSVPVRTRMVATAPLPGSSVASRTVPCARRAGLAFRSSSSAWRRIWSSSSSTFVPFLAEIAVDSTVPPNSSSTTPWARRSCLTFCGFAEVLGDAAGLARDDVRLAHIVQERRLAVVHVAHHRDDGGPGLQVLGFIGFDRRLSDGVVLLAYRLEAERRRDQLDHVEVEPLVDRHHLAQLLERERHELSRRDLE